MCTFPVFHVSEAKDVCEVPDDLQSCVMLVVQAFAYLPCRQDDRHPMKSRWKIL